MPDDWFKAQLGEPHHFGYVVDSIEATAERLVKQLGAGPFFLVEDVPLENVLSRGAPAQLTHNSAFGSCSGAAIELLEIERAAPERVEARWSGPRPRIHHVGYVVPRAAVAEVRASLDQRGLAEYLSSQLGELDMSFHDASTTLGHDLEIHVDVPGLHAFFAAVRAAADGWDGSDPLRPAPGG
jgi:methylmalonyl-CoA/ethylmalonyl-CoA epimerase